MQKKAVTKTLLMIMILFFWFAQYVYIPYHTPYLESLGAVSSFIGVIVGAYGLSQVLFRVPVGILADRRSPQKKLIFLGLLCAIAASSIRILFPVPAAFLAANFLSGMTSATWVSVTVFFSSLFEKSEMKKAMGFSIAGNNGGILLGFIASAFISDSLGVKFLFAASIISAALGLVTLLFVKEQRVDTSQTIRIDLLSILKDKSLIFYSLLGIVLQAVMLSTVLSFTTTYAKQLTSNGSELAFMMIVFIAVSVAASLMLGAAKKWSNKTMITLLLCCLVVYCVLTPLTTAMWQLYILQGIGGIANGALMSLLMTCAMENAKDGCRSTTMAVFQASYGIGMTLGPILMGVLVGHFGYTAGYLSMAALCAVSIAAVQLKIKEGKVVSRAEAAAITK
jgi:MFS family permease